jgi:hypothetical protein
MQNKNLKFIFVFLAIATGAYGGEYHAQADIICSDCHTTHYSEHGLLPERAEPGGPFSEMLIVGSVDRLCLSCHDGTDPSAPDVLAPVIMYNGSGSEFSSGGFFTAQEGIASEVAHDLGIDSPIPYSNPPRSKRLSCASCHNSHGNSNYRNLVPDPDSSGTNVMLNLGIDVLEQNHPANPPIRNASIEAYKAGNIGFKSNVIQWCEECHNSLSNTEPGMLPAHFQRHPIGVGLDGANYHVDGAHWISGTGDGFGSVTGDGIEGIPRMRFMAPLAADYSSSKTVGRTNQVFCYSCHFAHGGPYKSSLVWPFKNQISADLYSGCQQCHYK